MKMSISYNKLQHLSALWNHLRRVLGMKSSWKIKVYQAWRKAGIAAEERILSRSMKIV